MRLIDADALIVEIKNCLWDWESVNGITAKTVLTQTMTDIGNMPTIDPVKHGKWMAIGNTGLAACECGYVTDRYSIYNYCPNCGSKNGGEG